MPAQPHLLVAISPHGFGHTAQTAPVVNALRQRLPELRVTLRTTVNPALLAARFAGVFEHIAVATDFGMEMASAIDVLADASAQVYAQFHEDWGHKVEQEAEALAALNPDLILANVPYLTLAAAARAGIPAVAMSSLNWADIYGHYCGHYPGAAKIHAEILAAYNSTAGFLQTQPSMPMPDIAKRRAIGPVANVGKNRRSELNDRLGLAAQDRLVIIAPGGIPLRLPMEEWPRVPNIRWLVPAEWGVRRTDTVALETLGMHFTDILCSCDAFIGKPGYGSFAEAACNGVPVLYVKRHDWPEEPYLVDWLAHNGRCLEIEREDLQTGNLARPLARLWSLSSKPAIKPTGIHEATGYLYQCLQARRASVADTIPDAAQ
ncbi:MAG TPA: hypothetical protein VJM76_08495 [Gammaproteobacteria bacterium]|nr:hypothetical protein [Gammaproteobacteria bacterium]